MVQKTKPTKLGIQAASVKPSSGQHLEGKNKTADLKKKMKRSKSGKLSDTESLRSSSYSTPLKKSLDLPGKPPPLTNSSTTPTKKQSLIKTIDGPGSPNYMKSTSSSKARTESHQVSSQNLHRRNSSSPKSSGSAFSSRPAKTVARTFSLKLVRTLTKAPSFKHTRGPSKRSSRVALCADANVPRATCSSTMKDYKFPSYLELNHGGTESEGTSVLKVCPYNYCSLNGHHHSPLPPLKCFLSARRRSMKIQKGLKLEALSPRKNKPSGNVTVEIIKREQGQLDEPNMSPLVKEGSLDFYIEIYAKSRADDEGKQVSESLSDGAPHSEIDFDDNLEQKSIELRKKDGVKESMLPIYDPEVSSPSSEAEDVLCCALNMEWKEAQLSASEAENVAEFPTGADEQSQINRSDLQLEPVVFSDDNFINISEGISAAEDGWIGEQNRERDNTTHGQVASMEEDMFEVPAATEQDETEEINGVGIVLVLMEGLHKEAVEDSKNEVSDNDSAIDVKEGASVTSSSIMGEEGAWIDEQNLVTDSFVCDQVAPVEDDILEFPARIQKESDENNCTIDLKEEALDPTNNTYLPLFDELTDGCNEVTTTTCGSNCAPEILSEEAADHSDDQEEEKQVPGIAEEPSQEFTENESTKCEAELSDCDYEKENASEVQTDENESSLREAPSTEDNVESENKQGRDDVGLRTFTTANDKTMQDFLGPCTNRWTTRRNKNHEDFEEQREFNPRAPNFLPLVPETDAEKVDLRHQMMDEKKNAEEWMLDYALQKAVTKLAPAKNKKVALLVEAFEAVMPMPIPKFESHLRQSSAPFTQGRTIQACS